MRDILLKHILVRVSFLFCLMTFLALAQSHSCLAVHMIATLVTVLILKMLGSDARQVSSFPD